MRFLRWIFNISSRHAGDIRRYEKGKIGTKIFTIILTLILSAGTLALEYWSINLFESGNWALGLFVVLFLVIPVAGASFEFLGLYSFLGFRMFFWGTVEHAIKKIDKKIQENSISNGEQTEIVISAQNKSEKSHRWIDLFIGIWSIVLGIGLVVGMIAMLSIVK